MNNKVMACVDHSDNAQAVCDYSAWASQRLQAPLEIIHCLEEDHTDPRSDWSGSIGLGSQEALLEELAAVDAKRNALRMERGRLLLESARKRAGLASGDHIEVRLRNGDLDDSLGELEDEVRLFVIGKRGEAAVRRPLHIGTNLERVVRSLHRPILVVPTQFAEPRKIMLAFDGSMTTRKGVEMMASSPLFAGIDCHVVMVGAPSPASHAPIDWATSLLNAGQVRASGHLVEGEVEDALLEYCAKEAIDLLIMGAYGHSRIREFFVGSTTTTLLRSSAIPVLLLR